MSRQHDLGYLLMQETIVSGGDIHAQFNDVSKHEGPVSDLYGGLISCVLSCYYVLREYGVVPTHTDPAINAYFLSSKTGLIVELQRMSMEQRAKAIGALADIVTQCRELLVFKTTEIQPVQVAVTNWPTARTGPAEVRVTSLPTRTTTSEIERDSQGNIIATRQVETDAIV